MASNLDKNVSSSLASWFAWFIASLTVMGCSGPAVGTNRTGRSDGYSEKLRTPEEQQAYQARMRQEANERVRRNQLDREREHQQMEQAQQEQEAKDAKETERREWERMTPQRQADAKAEAELKKPRSITTSTGDVLPPCVPCPGNAVGCEHPLPCRAVAMILRDLAMDVTDEAEFERLLRNEYGALDGLRGSIYEKPLADLVSAQKTRISARLLSERQDRERCDADPRCARDREVASIATSLCRELATNREIVADIRDVKKYARADGVVDLSNLNDLSENRRLSDGQIAELKRQYREQTRRTFSTKACRGIDTSAPIGPLSN